MPVATCSVSMHSAQGANRKGQDRARYKCRAAAFAFLPHACCHLLRFNALRALGSSSTEEFLEAALGTVSFNALRALGSSSTSGNLIIKLEGNTFQWVLYAVRPQLLFDLAAHSQRSIYADHSGDGSSVESTELQITVLLEKLSAAIALDVGFATQHSYAHEPRPDEVQDSFRRNQGTTKVCPGDGSDWFHAYMKDVRIMPRTPSLLRATTRNKIMRSFQRNLFEREFSQSRGIAF